MQRERKVAFPKPLQWNFLQFANECGAVERKAGFWDSVRAELARQDSGERQALVFLHGYNVPFQASAIRAAQLGFDLKVPGLTAFFSWPSGGRLFRYPNDEASIEASESAITTTEVRDGDLFDLFDLKHSYFATGAGLLHDMFDVLRRNVSPDDRQRTVQVQTPEGAVYWRLEN